MLLFRTRVDNCLSISIINVVFPLALLPVTIVNDPGRIDDKLKRVIFSDDMFIKLLIDF